jgi:hypothetical protein
MNIQEIIKSARSNPRAALLYCLEEESGDQGWYRPALIDHAASMILGSPDETIGLTEGELLVLLKDGSAYINEMGWVCRSN